MPKRTRPNIPTDNADVSDESKMLTWGWVSDQMRRAHNYWVCTVTPDGAPHAVPVWGVWLNETLYFASSTTSRKGRNIATNPRLVVHLESGDETVIFEGYAEIETTADTLKQIVTDYGQKYPYQPTLPMPADEVFYRLVSQKVLAWLESDFPNTAARFTFD